MKKQKLVQIRTNKKIVWVIFSKWIFFFSYIFIFFIPLLHYFNPNNLGDREVVLFLSSFFICVRAGSRVGFRKNTILRTTCNKNTLGKEIEYFGDNHRSPVTVQRFLILQTSTKSAQSLKI